MGYQLGGFQRTPQPPVEVEAVDGLVVEVVGDRFVGAVVDLRSDAVVLEDRSGRRRVFPWQVGGFRVEGRPATLVRPSRQAATPATTRSGSRTVRRSRARVAAASRIWVEGLHDAELLEHVWGEDLRWVGVVVEPLHGADDLAARVDAFQPTADARLGVLLDHLVPGSKEARIAQEIRHPHVLVRGHPFVDIWGCIDPALIGRDRWPDVPLGTPWKEGVCRALGVRSEPGEFWRSVLARVSSARDLDRSLRRVVEELIDFVSGP